MKVEHGSGFWADVRDDRWTFGDLEAARADGWRPLMARFVTAWSVASPITEEGIANLDGEIGVWLETEVLTAAAALRTAQQERYGDPKVESSISSSPSTEATS